MKSKKLNNEYILKLEKGEEIIETLAKFCEDNNIKSGSITGIGGTDNAILKYYDREKKEYTPKNFSGRDYEIISLIGNISLVDGKPFAHIHITLGDAEYNVFGGHLGSAVISITCEIAVTMTDGILNRKLDDEFKLNFLDI